MQRYTKTTSRTVAWLKGVSDSQRLVLAPPFQRNPVWTEKQQSALIETILLEYPIPELYMQDVVDVTGDEEHIVVDGQQRVRAVLDYINGEFDITDDISRWAGVGFDDLSIDEKRRIFEYDFVVRMLPQMDDEQIRSIFQRINRTNVALNAQELRHATYWGPFIKSIEAISDLEFWDIAGIFTANDRRRMLDAEFISEISIAYLNGLQNKKSKLEEYYRIYEQDFTEARGLRRVFDTVLGEIEAVLPDIRKTRWKKKSDFYTLFLVIAAVPELLPMTAVGRKTLRGSLIAFDQAVTHQIAGRSETLDLLFRPETVAKYASNVERAASDLSSRRGRRDALNEALDPVFKSEKITRIDLTKDASPDDMS